MRLHFQSFREQFPLHSNNSKRFKLGLGYMKSGTPGEIVDDSYKMQHSRSVIKFAFCLPFSKALPWMPVRMVTTITEKSVYIVEHNGKFRVCVPKKCFLLLFQFYRSFLKSSYYPSVDQTVCFMRTEWMSKPPLGAPLVLSIIFINAQQARMWWCTPVIPSLWEDEARG